MRTTDTVESRTLEEVRVTGLVGNHPAGVLVRLVARVKEAEIGQRQERGDIGIVHKNTRAIAVNLEGINITVFGVVEDAVLADSRGEFGATLL